MKSEGATQQSADQADDGRGRSTIDFPYVALDDSAEIVQGVRDVGATKCDIDQLAAKLGQAGNGGGFRQRVYGARTFGLITTDRRRIELTPLGIRLVDPKLARSARVEAFLFVALFKKIFDQIKGQVLPPPPAMERMMQAAGVAPKQCGKARQTFMRSAKVAGFFELAADRLVMPANIAMQKVPADDTQPQPKVRDAVTLDPEARSRNGNGSGGGGGDYAEIHPAILGLLRDLPKAGSPLTDKRRKSLIAAFTSAIDYIFPEPDEVQL